VTLGERAHWRRLLGAAGSNWGFSWSWGAVELEKRKRKGKGSWRAGRLRLWLWRDSVGEAPDFVAPVA